MSEKIKEINFEELWNKIREMGEKAALADEACTLDNKRDVFEGDGEYNFCINCGARLKEEEK